MYKNILFVCILIIIWFVFFLSNRSFDKNTTIKESAYIGIQGDSLILKDIYINGQKVNELGLDKKDILTIEENISSDVFRTPDGRSVYNKNGEYVLCKNHIHEPSCIIVLINGCRITLYGYRKEDLDFLNR